MRKQIFTIIFVLFSYCTTAQAEYKIVDQNSKSTPDSLSSHVEISKHLVQKLKTDREKARAIYIWIAHNIQYDLALLDSEPVYESEQEIIDDVLENRQGVCMHYAELFHAMCESAGLNSFVIGGYTQNDLGISDSAHAWNLIILDAEYFFIDVTWASGFVQDENYIHKFTDDYFLIRPQSFIKDHIPFDPIWQCLSDPLSYQEFERKTYSKSAGDGSHAYKDSIQSHISKTRIVQYEDSYRRIIKFGNVNGLTTGHLEHLNANVQKHLRYLSLQMSYDKFNSAIDTFNYGVDRYNTYISHRNNQFRKPKLNDEVILGLIESAGGAIRSGKEQLSNINSSDSELREAVKVQLEDITELESLYSRQHDFVNRYIKKRKPFRMILFFETN